MLGTKGRIFHVSPDDGLRKSRDAILRFHGYDVASSGSSQGTAAEVARGGYHLVLIDVTGPGGVTEAQRLCDEIKRLRPGQHVAYVCDHVVYLETACPDDVIRTQFDPEKFLRSVQEAMKEAMADAKQDGTL